MHAFEYREPRSLEEAYAALAAYGEDARPVAGGTALVLLMRLGLARPGCLVSLRRIAGLGAISAADGVIRLGALVTHRRAERDPLVGTRLPLLTEAYRHVATVRIRNAATVGGGLAHGDPAQDPPAALLALDARVRLSSAAGSRTVPLHDFYRDYYETVLQPGELLTELEVPMPPAGARWGFIKFLPRTGAHCREARIGLTCVGPTPIRARRAEAVLRGARLTPELLRAAAEEVRNEVQPTSDLRGSAEYKRDMAVLFTRRALEQALAQPAGNPPQDRR
ncbi:MAG: xanthine dehydrogenase family protein subunit M [Deltaproteobacteria bacterium]|nr:xanthine dehydrogenase family protein subunit M [Deltaproteobacteria bacterium]